MIHQIKQNELPQNLWQFIEAALHGETVYIQGENKSLIQRVPLKQISKPRKAGSAQGLIHISDDFDAPLDDFARYL